jgi:hypothetical protein
MISELRPTDAWNRLLLLAFLLLVVKIHKFPILEYLELANSGVRAKHHNGDYSMQPKSPHEASYTSKKRCSFGKPFGYSSRPVLIISDRNGDFVSEIILISPRARFIAQQLISSWRVNDLGVKDRQSSVVAQDYGCFDLI